MSKGRQRQLLPSSSGARDATSKAPFPERDRSATTQAQTRCCIRCLFELWLLPLDWCWFQGTSRIWLLWGRLVPFLFAEGPCPFFSWPKSWLTAGTMRSQHQKTHTYIQTYIHTYLHTYLHTYILTYSGIYAGPPDAGPLDTLPKGHFKAHKPSKNVSFCWMEPFEWRFGVHKAPVKGPPCNAQLWDLAGSLAGPAPALKIGHFGIFFLFRSFCLKTLFYCVLYKISFQKFKILGTRFSRMFDPWKPIWTRIGPFCGPWTALLNGTPNSSRTKDKDKPKNDCNTKPNVSQGRANHEVQTVNWNTGIFEAEGA